MVITILNYAEIFIVLVITALCGLFLYKFAKANKAKSMMNTFKEKTSFHMRKSKLDFFNYSAINLYLSKNGVYYMFKFMDPFYYIIIKVVMALLVFMAVTSLMGVFIGVIGFIIGFFAFNLLIKYSNSRDNEKMIDDIQGMYVSIKAQIKAGVYLTNALAEAYTCVESDRLKLALLELNSKIMANKNIENAVDEFNLLFNDKYIDTFCIVIKQSLESGKSVRALDDVTKQIVDMQHALNSKDQEALDRKMQLIQLGMFAGLLGMILVYLFTQFSFNTLF